jgi:hypothetical protein
VIEADRRRLVAAAPKAVSWWQVGTLPLKNEASQLINLAKLALGSDGKATFTLDRGAGAATLLPLGSGASLRLPARMTTDYRLSGNSFVMTFTGTQPRLVIGSLIGIDIGGVTVGETTGRLRLDWYPDVTWGLK